MLLSSASVMGVGFTLGLMHALDADHVMAVSTLSNTKPSFWRTVRFSLHWALGHGGVLIVAGLLLFGLGLSIPETLQQVAEASVGVLLIALGLVCFWRFRKERLQLSLHRHGDIEHVHWHVKGDHSEQPNDDTHSNKTKDQPTKDSHAPVMVGVLHGLAGSAPALALVPAVAEGELVNSVLYLLIFSLGVMLSMLCFASGFGALQAQLQQKYQRLFQWNRYLIASFAMLLGGFWLSQAV